MLVYKIKFSVSIKKASTTWYVCKIYQSDNLAVGILTETRIRSLVFALLSVCKWTHETENLRMLREHDLFTLTLSLPRCHLKTNDKNAKFEIRMPFFVFVLALASERISVKTHSIKNRFI